MAYSLAKVGGLWEYLGQNERLSLLLSAICHDVEHPGVSGAYLHKARAPLATWFQGDPGLLLLDLRERERVYEESEYMRGE